MYFAFFYNALAQYLCDQIGQFIGLWATFQSFWQQLICPNLPHSQAIFVTVSKSINFLVKSFFCNFYRHLAIFSGHTAQHKPRAGEQYTFSTLLYDLRRGLTILVLMEGVCTDQLLLLDMKQVPLRPPDMIWQYLPMVSEIQLDNSCFTVCSSINTNILLSTLSRLTFHMLHLGRRIHIL